jgi:chromosome segregation ATPase
LSIGLLALPAVVSAAPLDLVTTAIQSAQPKVAELKLKYPVKLPNSEAFCSAISDTKAKLETKVVEREAAVTTYLDTLPEELENERNGRDAKLEEGRSLADQERSEWYARLADRADGDNEEEAVEDYQKQIEEAVDDRRDAIDAAILEFRTGTDALITKRKSAMQSARDTFRTSVGAALDKLEADCTNGVATATILSNFKASLESARTKLANDKKAAESMQGEMKKLADTRKASVAAALKTFQTELARANTELKQAFEGE